MLGTIIFLGLSIGSIVGMKLFSDFEQIQDILVASLAVQSMMLLSFTINLGYKISLAIRLL